ncbi:putative phosphatase regulatory subunit-domain-containing protein [Dichotomocladium elegans]|nr:putative phosphatase regulatory subunit-domain-containing protein [Dichotomocladium elegans]
MVINNSTTATTIVADDGDDARNSYFGNAHASQENQSVSRPPQPVLDRNYFPSHRRRTPREPITRFRPHSKEAWFRQEERMSFTVRVANATLPGLNPKLNPVCPSSTTIIHLWDLTAIQPLLDSSEVMLFGHCLVANLSFEKQVFVRYTTDAWETHIDVEATYHDSLATGGLDRFSFKLMMDPEKEIQLALRYIVNGQEYWDNNNSENYRLSLEMKSEVVNVPVAWTAEESDKDHHPAPSQSEAPTQKPIMWSQKTSALSNYTSIDSCLASFSYHGWQPHNVSVDSNSFAAIQNVNSQDNGIISSCHPFPFRQQ